MLNSTEIDNCTLSTCPLSLSRTGYVPNLGGNIFFVAWFGALLVAQLALSIRFRTFSFLIGQFCGLVLEVIGYVARVKLHSNPFKQGSFIAYIVPVTIAPAFFCFTIYLCFGRVVLVFGKSISRIPHRAYTLVFVSLDILCLILQASGAAGTQSTSSPTTVQTSLKVLKAGLGLQVASLAVFLLLALEFTFQALKRKEKWSYEHEAIRSSPSFRLFILSSLLAAILILIRSAYRVAELQGGVNSGNADNEVLFMVFEGAVIGVAVLLLTAFHPGFTFGGEWRSLSFFAKRGRNTGDNAVELRDSRRA